MVARLAHYQEVKGSNPFSAIPPAGGQAAQQGNNEGQQAGGFMSFRDKFKGLIAEDKAKDADAVFDELDKVLDTQAKDLRDLKTQLRQKDGIKPEDLAVLEAENTKLKADLSEAQKTSKKYEAEAKGATEKLAAEQGAISKLLVDNGLTEGLTKLKIKPEHLPYVKAGLSSRIALETDGDMRKAIVMTKDKDGKDVKLTLSDFLEKHWATGEGKAFIPADQNAGGGGGPPSGGNGKVMKNAEFDQLRPADQAKFINAGGRTED